MQLHTPKSNVLMGVQGPSSPGGLEERPATAPADAFNGVDGCFSLGAGQGRLRFQKRCFSITCDHLGAPAWMTKARAAQETRGDTQGHPPG